MLQRIQTVYLLGAAICCLLMFFFHFSIIEYSDGKYYSLDAINVTHHDEHNISEMMKTWPVTILSVIVQLLSIVCIFKYQHRPMQLKLCKINALLLLVLIVAVFFYSEKGQSTLDDMGIESVVQYKFGTYLPIIAVVLTHLANLAILKDEKLVRSADRIR